MVTYNQVMKGLGIEIIDIEKSPNVSLKSSIFVKKGLKIQKLEEIKGILHYITFLRYHHGFWYISFSRKKGVYT